MEGKALPSDHFGPRTQDAPRCDLGPARVRVASILPNRNAPPESKVGGDLVRLEDEPDGTDATDAN